jgi:oxygen-independent coproporphyrinogen-3 oxidase
VAALPRGPRKLALFRPAQDAFLAAGYQQIGMDHFALPEDELALAARDGTLWRNFMGYTVRRGSDLLGFGLSAIGDIDGVFFQNHRKLHRYEGASGAGGLATERGYAPTPDVERRFGVRFDDVFRHELDALRPLEADGLVRIDANEVAVTEKLFVRNVCMVFDAYLTRHRERPRWSRTV